MNKTVYQIMSVIVAFALTFGSFTSAGASSASGILSISTPTIYDCKNGTMAGITIKNTHDVTVKNCNIIVTSENGIQVTDSYNILIDNVDINSTYPEGSGINLESTASGLTHDVTISNFHIHGPMGWGIAGSYQSLLRITVKQGTIEGIGQAGGQQKHGIYLNNWASSLIDGVTIKDSWNSGIKIVGIVSDLRINKVAISNSGRSGGSGPGISLDSATITGLVITGCNISNSANPAIWTLAKVNGVTVDGCNFFNNYYAVEIPSGGSGWRVVNNVGYNKANYAPARTSLQLDGSNSDVANNFFDYNNWYYDGLSPVRVGSTTLSLAGWQAKGADQHSVSINPNAVTATPSVIPTITLTSTPTPIATSTTPTASSVQASLTPTALSVATSATPTVSFTSTSPAPTASPEPASPTPTALPIIASATPTASSIPASPTPTASPVPAPPTLTALPVVASATPTASPIPASPTPTASSEPASPTPTASTIPASPTPTASSMPASPTPTESPVPASPAPTEILVQIVPTSTSAPVPPVPPVAASVQVKDQPISGIVYDDKDSGFVYSPGWQDVPKQKAYDGSYKQTTKNGSFATFTFTGQSFSILYESGLTFRKIGVYVDGLLVGTINEKGRSSTYKKRWDYPGQLTLGSHTLKLVFITGSVTNTSGSIDAVIVH